MKLKFSLSIATILMTAYIQGASAQCNTIDAVTTASFKITGGQACSTYANLNWTFTRNNGTMTIEWGKTTTYGTSKSVYSAKPVNLPNLTPATKYYYHVSGFYQNKTYQYTTSSFTTAAGSTVAITSPATSSAAAPGGALYFGTTRLNVSGLSGQPLVVALYALNGTRIMTHSFPVPAGRSEHMALPPAAVPGMYLVKISNAAGSSTQRIVIRN